MHPSKERVNYHHNFSQMFMLTGNHYFLSLCGTVLTIFLPTRIHDSKVISWHMTVQVVWNVLVWGLTFQLPQQTVVIRITSQGVFTKCSSFQISHLIITADFTPFGGCLQLDHPVTCENIRCYSHIQIITWWTGKSSMCFSCFCHSKYYRSIRLPLNPSIPESDQHLISPYYITSESYIEVMRIKEMITNYRSSRLSNKFSLIAPDSMENTHNDVRV